MAARGRRGSTSLSGILPVDKPSGMTSHDVVSRVRHAGGERRVGHAGTLDPAATGLLVVLVGPMTRLARYMEAGRKTYLASVEFGRETTTDDAEGETTAISHVPARLADAPVAGEAIAALVGAQDQVPPGFSAVKVGGRKAYDLARRGEAPELEPRRIEVFAARLLAVEAGPPVVWDVEIECSKGTYVRSLARDLGRSLGTAAHLRALRRVASGTLDVGASHSLEEVEAAGREPGGIASLFTDPLAALGLPVLALDASAAADVAVGRPLTAALAETAGLALGAGDTLALTFGGELLGVYRAESGMLVPEVVLPRAATPPMPEPPMPEEDA